MDICGRKYPISIGVLVAGVFILLIPLFKTVYPGFFICRAFISLGTILLINVPLIPDYVQMNSIGLTSSISAVVVAVNNFFAGTVIL